MDADPPSTPPAQPEESGAEFRKFILPKQKRRYRRPGDTDGEEEHAEEDEAALLNTALQRFLQRKKDDGEKPRPARGSINRFLARAESAPTPAPTTEPDEKTVPPPDQAASTTFPKFRPRTAGGPLDPWMDRAYLWRRVLWYVASAAALVVASFFTGRRSAPDAVPPPPRETTQAALWQLTFSDSLEKALAADHAGDLTAALQLVDSLPERVKRNPALQAYRATLNTRLGQTGQAEMDLYRLLGPTPTPDVSYPLNVARAFNFVRQREFDHALPCFAAVAQIQPFDVTNLTHWAETLRRKGDHADAIDMFQAALARLPTTDAPYVTAQREYLAYEQRLSRIESGHAAEVRAELDPQLRAPTPSGYWRMTAAALALQSADMKAATAALSQARAVFTPGEFDTLVGDFFFRSFTYRAEMNGFARADASNRPPPKQSSMDYFLDP